MPDTPKPTCPPHPSYDANGLCVSCGFNGRTGVPPVVETGQAALDLVADSLCAAVFVRAGLSLEDSSTALMVARQVVESVERRIEEQRTSAKVETSQPYEPRDAFIDRICRELPLCDLNSMMAKHHLVMRLAERETGWRASAKAEQASGQPSPIVRMRPCASCSAGGDYEAKQCALREDTGVPDEPVWLCDDCYNDWRQRP